MKRLFTALAGIVILTGTAWSANPTVTWESLGNRIDPTGQPAHTERFTIHQTAPIKRLCFNRLARKMAVVNPNDTIGEIIPGYYYLASPRLMHGGERDVVIELSLPWALENFNYEPDGFHAVMANGEVVPVKFSRQSLMVSSDRWSTPQRDLMPRGRDIYELNERLTAGHTTRRYDIIPSFKSVTYLDGEPDVAARPRVVMTQINDPRPDFYRITIAGDSIAIGYTSQNSRRMATRVVESRLLPGGDTYPAAVIEDYPSLPYRALMLDVARNFFNVGYVQRLVQLMASYRLNVLHFHPFDDEGWRVEIPGLPELTDVGARRGYTTDESGFLAQLFAGNGNPDTDAGTANGYITRREFVDLLKYCNSLGISVVPEIESPGHARAAIKAMRARAARTGDTTYLLDELTGNESEYTSAQAFHDNVMNPALPGTYRFMGKIIDELIAMYDEACAPLLGIHIGGDEVPARAWDGSPAVNAMMKEHGMTTHREVHAAFVDSIASMLAQRGVKMFGWQEIALNHPDEFNRRVAPLTAGVNCWTNVAGGNPTKIVNAGFPVILSCVDRFYLDQCYNRHPMEQGLTWGGTVDEFVSLSGYPSTMGVAVDSVTAAGGRVVGISGHLFGETLRKPEQVEYMILPKMFGLAERAWNADSTYTDAEFNTLVAGELLQLARRGFNFHLRQPGLKIEDGKVYMNSPYPNSVIRYTLDGSEPDENSPAYEQPFPLKPGDEPRARLYYCGKHSLTTVM